MNQKCYILSRNIGTKLLQEIPSNTKFHAKNRIAANTKYIIQQKISSTTDLVFEKCHAYLRKKHPFLWSRSLESLDYSVPGLRDWKFIETFESLESRCKHYFQTPLPYQSYHLPFVRSIPSNNFLNVDYVYRDKQKLKSVLVSWIMSCILAWVNKIWCNDREMFVKYCLWKLVFISQFLLLHILSKNKGKKIQGVTVLSQLTGTQQTLHLIRCDFLNLYGAKDIICIADHISFDKYFDVGWEYNKRTGLHQRTRKR